MKTRRFTHKLTVNLGVILTLLLAPVLSYGQALNGSKFIPGNYATLDAAISDLNTNGVGTGGVIFNIAAGTTETAPAGGYTITATGTAANPIVFRKDPSTSGVNPLISSPVGTTTNLDAIFYFTGVDYITIKGIDLMESSSNTTPTTQMEFGYAFLKRNSTAPFDGCQHDTIMNCNITLNRTNTVSRGIYLHNHTKTSITTLIPTAIGDANSYNSFLNNTIQNVNSGIYVYGYNASAPFTLQDQYNVANNNTILNYGGTTIGYGIYTYYQGYNSASNNNFDNYNNGTSGAIGATAAIYGIYNYCITSANPSNSNYSNNYINLTQNGGSSGVIYGIYSYYPGGNIVVNNNIIKFNTLGTTACTGAFYGTYIYPSANATNLQYKNNHIDSITVNSSSATIYGHYVYGVGSTSTDVSENTFTYFKRNMGTTGGLYCMYAYGTNAYTNASSVYNFYNNVVDSVVNGTSTGTIYCNYSSGGYTSNIYNNTISRIYSTSNTGSLFGLYPYYYATNINVYNNTISNFYTAGTVYGVYYYGYYFETSNVYNNTISNLNTSGAGSSLVGFYVTYGGKNNFNFYKNKIYTLSATGNSTCASQGMLLYNSTSGALTNMAMNIYNNLFSDIQAPNSTSTTVCVSGININYSSYPYRALLYNNTINLEGLGGANAHSSCVFVNNTTPPILRMNNNILINKLSHSGTGIASSYFRSGASFSGYDNLSNNNLMYAGIPSGKNVIYFDGSNKDSLMSQYKTRMSPREGNSSSENVSFISTSVGSSYYLMADTTIATSIESGASPIAGITSDFWGNIRAGNAGYSGTGNAPDLGAIEANFTPIPMIYDSNNVDQITIAALAGKTNQAVLRIRVYTENLYNPLQVTRLKLNTAGTSSLGDISNAKIYFTGSSSEFSTQNQFGSTVSSPNGIMFVNGTQNLLSGVNYFWLSYDISASANTTNVVDGRVDSIRISGTYYSPIDGDPFGGTPIATPLNGTYTIGSAPYFNLASAINDLNNKGVNSNVEILVPAGYTEQAPVGGYKLGSTLLNNNLNGTYKLKITKSGIGPNPLLFAQTGTSTTIDGIFFLLGVDFVTINGIDLVDTNTISVTTQMEQGYGLVKLNAFAPFDGCQYDTIMNSTITLNRSNINSRGIYLNNVVYTDPAAVPLNITSPSDANSYNVFLLDTIQNTSTAVVFSGYNAGTNFSLYDRNNVFGSQASNGNVIVNYNGAGGTAYGVYLMQQLNMTVSGNTIDNYNNGIAGAVGASSIIYGIFQNFTNTASANPANFTVSNNNIKISTASGSGAQYGIYMQNGGGDYNINNNQVRFGTIGTNLASGAMYGIYFYPTYSGYLAGTVNIKNNRLDSITVNNNTGAFYALYTSGGGKYEDYSGNSLTLFTRSSATTGAFYGWYFNNSYSYNVVGSTTNIYNNTIDSIINGNSTGVVNLSQISGGKTLNFNNNSTTRVYALSSANFYGLYTYYYSANANVFNNTISTLKGGTSNLFGLYGYWYYMQTANCYNNNINNLSASGSAYGIYTMYGPLNLFNIYKNNIHSISTSGTANASGIYHNNSTSGAPANTPVLIYNNAISNITAPAGTGSPSVTGMLFTYASYNYFAQVYHNTINLSGSLASNGSSAGIYIANLTPTIRLQNNIIVNNSTVSGIGVAAAIRRFSAALSTYDLNSNGNLLYSGTPSLSNVIYYDGTNKDQTISSYKNRLSPAEANSFTENPVFINSTLPSAANYMRPDTSIATGIESGAIRIAGLVDDFVGNIRQGNTGYSGSGNAPDVGAVEGNYILNDLIAPVITYTPVGNTGSTGDRILTVNIKDNTGVPLNSNSPLVYYKKSSAGTYLTAMGTKISGNVQDGNWTFTISATAIGGLSLGDSIYYYFVAEDSSALVNFGSLPAGVIGTGVGTITAAPANLFNYKVVPGISGNITVGATGTYTNLTNPGGAFDAINNSALSGNVTLTIVSDLNESNAITLKKWSETGTGNYRLRIVPDSNIERQIVDTAATPVANSSVITFDGVNRVTVDGRYNGNGRYLRFRNRGANGIAFYFINDAMYDTIMYSNIECVTTVTATIVFGASNVQGGRGNDSNVVMYNNIGDTLGAIAPAGASNTGFFSQGTSGKENDANTIAFNNIFNFGYNAINLNGTGTGNNWVIYGNKIYQTANRTTGPMYIFSIAGGGGHIIRKNSVGGAAPDRSGIPMNTSNNTIMMVYQTNNSPFPNTIDSNTMANIYCGTIYGIDIINGGASIIANTIGGMQNPWDSIVAINNFYGVYAGGPGNTIINNNHVGNVRYIGGSTGVLMGIHNVSYGAVNTNNFNNIHDLIGNGTGNFPNKYHIGICVDYSNYAANVMIENNTVYNIINEGFGYASGISAYQAYAPFYINKNKIYNISAANNTTAGIYTYYNAAPIKYTNNQITLTRSSMNGIVAGIFDASQYANSNAYYNNSIYIGGAASPSSLTNSYCLYRNQGFDQPDIKNNILYNNRRGGLGVHFAAGISNSAGISLSSFNYNLMVVNDTTKMLEFPGPVSMGLNDLSNYFSGTLNSNWAAPTSLVPTQTLFTDTANCNLSIINTHPNSWYANGKGLALSDVAVDFNGASRSVSINTGTTDLGAFEFNTSTLPPAAYASAIPALNSTTHYYFGGRSIASITWGNTGTVPTSVNIQYYTGNNAPFLIPSKAQYNAYQTVTPTGGASYTYNYSMGYDSSMLGNVSSSANSRMARYKSPNWYFVPSSIANASMGKLNAGTLMASNTLPANFTGTDNINPLPVELLNITATQETNDVLVKWSTASEINSSRFEIERSMDMENFEFIGSVRGAGNSQKQNNYQFKDEGVFAAIQTGVVYYRLKITDLDGTQEYSPIVSVSIHLLPNESKVSVYPNPFNNKLNLNLNSNSAGIATIKLFDVTGSKRMEFTQEMKEGMNSLPGDSFLNLSNGIYFLTVDMNGTHQVSKLIKE